MTEYKENAIDFCRSFRENRTKLKFRGRVLLGYSISQRDVKRINTFLSGSPTDMTDDETTAETAGEVYKRIGTVTNRETGDEVQFVNAAFGKIERHKGYDPRLIGQLAGLFEQSAFLFDETADYETPRGDGTEHKHKNNITSFSNYGAKVRLDNCDFIVRYTVQNLKKKNGEIRGRQFHSQQISAIKTSNLPMTSPLSVGAEGSAASDYKLASFLNAVNIAAD